MAADVVWNVLREKLNIQIQPIKLNTSAKVWPSMILALYEIDHHTNIHTYAVYTKAWFSLSPNMLCEYYGEHACKTARVDTTVRDHARRIKTHPCCCVRWAPQRCCSQSFLTAHTNYDDKIWRVSAVGIYRGNHTNAAWKKNGISSRNVPENGAFSKAELNSCVAPTLTLLRQNTLVFCFTIPS